MNTTTETQECAMRLMYSPIMQAWMFIYGRTVDTANIIQMGDGPRFFDDRDDAIAAANGCRLRVDSHGIVHAIEEQVA